MTLKEEAYALIDKLPDKVMGELVQRMKRMMDDPSTWKEPFQEVYAKMDALRDLQILREDARRLGSMEAATARAEAIFEKYGV